MRAAAPPRRDSGKRRRRKNKAKRRSSAPASAGEGWGGAAADGRWRRVVLAGKWPTGDESWRESYEGWPLGLVLEVFPTGGGEVGVGVGGDEEDGERGWAARSPMGDGFADWVAESLRGLPPLDKTVRCVCRGVVVLVCGVV